MKQAHKELNLRYDLVHPATKYKKFTNGLKPTIP